MPDWDSLKLHLSIQILPGNVQDIRLDCSSYDLKTSDLILCLARRHAIDPGSVRNNGFSIWLHGVYAVEPDMRTRRARGRPFVLQEYCQNVNGFKDHLRRISELQADPRVRIHKADYARRAT